MILIEGSNLRLRRADLSDLNFILDLQVKPENVKFIVPFSKEFHTKTLNSDCAKNMDVIVEERESNDSVGYFMLSEMDNPHNKVEITHVIMDKKGLGYGREALTLLLNWIFGERNYHRAFLDCKEYNSVALRLYENLGFKREGVMRDVILTNGVYENLVLLGMLDREFQAKI